MPYERYRLDLQQEGFQHDPAQERAIQYLQRIYDQLMATPGNRAPTPQKTGLFGRLVGRDKPADRRRSGGARAVSVGRRGPR
jgi:cell division protein ZapE